MIFQHTIEKVLDGTKTQTRRIVKVSHDYAVNDDLSIYTVMRTSDYADVYRVGKTYAVQPGRGKKAVARIRITSIRREDVRNITIEDVKAEGFQYKYDFLQVWTDMHDSQMGNWLLETEYDPLMPNHCPLFLGSRPAERYEAWALQFELVAS